MGKRMKLPFPFIKSAQLDQQWPWPSCGNSTNTLSFRSSVADAGTTSDDMFKTINSAYEEMGATTTTESSSSQLGNPVDDSEDDSVIQGVMQSERLFFTPGETNSILEEAKSKKNKNGFLGIKEIKSVVMEEMESTNPYVDFRKSMEEMVEASEGLKESVEGLHELLSCYLTVNERNNHGYIVGAFVDLLTSLFLDQEEEEENQNHNNNNNDLSSSSNSPISALSFTSNSSSTCTSSTARSTTPCLSCSEGGGGGGGGGGDESTSSSEKTNVVVGVEEEENAFTSCSLQV